MFDASHHHHALPFGILTCTTEYHNVLCLLYRYLWHTPFVPLSVSVPLYQQSAVALDQQAIEQQIGKKNDVGLQNGQDIYEQGAFSKPVARLELTAPLASSVSKGKKITGRNANGEVITGKAFQNHDAGDMSLFVQYTTNEDPKFHVECAVGGLQSADQRTEGCKFETINFLIRYSEQ